MRVLRDGERGPKGVEHWPHLHFFEVRRNGDPPTPRLSSRLTRRLAGDVRSFS